MRGNVMGCVIPGTRVTALLAGSHLPGATDAKVAAVRAQMHVISLTGDPLHPRTLYVGGSAASSDNFAQGYFDFWRSTDEGTTWSELGHALTLGHPFVGHDDNTDPTSPPHWGGITVDPFHIAPDDSFELAALHGIGWTPGSAYNELIRPTDGGLHWTIV